MNVGVCNICLSICRSVYLSVYQMEVGHVVSMTTVFLAVVTVTGVECNHSYEKFQQLGCRGEYNKFLFEYLDRLCWVYAYDTDNISEYHIDAATFYNCRSNCFTSANFYKCLVDLELLNQTTTLAHCVTQLSGKKVLFWNLPDMLKKLL